MTTFRKVPVQPVRIDVLCDCGTIMAYTGCSKRGNFEASHEWCCPICGFTEWNKIGPNTIAFEVIPVEEKV